MRELVAIIAGTLLDVLGLRRTPKIDVFEVASLLGIRVDYARIAGDGRIDLGVEPRVLLNTRASRRCQRFTLAHELGHWMLSNPEVRAEARKYGLTQRAVEGFCQKFAAELLMPSWWIHQRFARAPVGLDSVSRLADSADVSLTSAHIRFAELEGWKTTLLLFDRRRDWMPLVVAGEPRRSRGTIHLVSPEGGVLDEIWDQHRGAEDPMMMTLRLTVRDSRVSVAAELRPTNRGMLALLPLRAALGEP